MTQHTRVSIDTIVSPEGETEYVVQRGAGTSYERDPGAESFMSWNRLVLWNLLAHLFNAEGERLIALRVTKDGIHARLEPEED